VVLVLVDALGIHVLDDKIMLLLFFPTVDKELTRNEKSLHSKRIHEDKARFMKIVERWLFMLRK